jgi:hypothetical protein
VDQTVATTTAAAPVVAPSVDNKNPPAAMPPRDLTIPGTPSLLTGGDLGFSAGHTDLGVHAVGQTAALKALKDSGLAAPSADNLAGASIVDIDALGKAGIVGADGKPMPTLARLSGQHVTMAMLMQQPEMQAFLSPATGESTTAGAAKQQAALSSVQSSIGAMSTLDLGALNEFLAVQQDRELNAVQANTTLTDQQKSDQSKAINAKYAAGQVALQGAGPVALTYPVLTGEGVQAGMDPAAAPSYPTLRNSEPPTSYGAAPWALGFNTTVVLIDSAGDGVDIPSPSGGYIKSLKLSMSPDTLSTSHSKVVNRYQTLTRWVEEHWGDEIDGLSFSGTTFGFLTKDGYLLTPDRRDTAAYKELQHLVDIYKLNGGVYQEANRFGEKRSYRTFYAPDRADPVRQLVAHPRAGMLRTRLYVKLAFDFAEFIGYFESFTVDEDADHPLSLKYSVSFKSEKTTWL